LFANHQAAQGPMSSSERRSAADHRGLVGSLRFVAVRLVGFFADADARFFFGDGFLTVAVAVDPDDTREECLALWRTAFVGAASAAELSAKDASSATTNIFRV
jgi:hypothetical protein